mgnify:CR=1 FL=1
MSARATCVELARELVRIPSVNPEGDPGVAEVGERACAEFVAGVLGRAGAEVTLDEVLPGRPNVVGRFPVDRAGKPRLVFAPHTDTVSVAGMSIEPFAATLRDGRLYGRGASDTKGPMAAMLAALLECRELLPRLPCEIWFAGLMGEESGLLGSRDFVARHAVDFALVGEPTGLRTVHAHKGCAWIRLRTRGRASHASTPAAGENAIHPMLGALDEVVGAVTPELAAIDDPLLGQPTISVGVINGGSKVNIVPANCSCDIDLRTVPAMDVDAYLARLRARLTARAPGLEFEARQAPPLHTRPEGRLFECLAAAGSALTTAPWFCDAAIFGAAGTPAVAVGPGSIGQAHTADEFIAVDDLEAGGEFFARLLRELAARRSLDWSRAGLTDGL